MYFIWGSLGFRKLTAQSLQPKTDQQGWFPIVGQCGAVLDITNWHLSGWWSVEARTNGHQLKTQISNFPSHLLFWNSTGSTLSSHHTFLICALLRFSSILSCHTYLLSHQTVINVIPSILSPSSAFVGFPSICWIVFQMVSCGCSCNWIGGD